MFTTQIVADPIIPFVQRLPAITVFVGSPSTFA